ncbi:UNVERIFIED_CONTAM: Serine/threonine-protein phosphatase 7 [Sesamum calycinum]|uniref:Serine/threonine-protein phosphatase 7 n=1 Tax=Sesamum calycinum TaxID=2727403 RepID=A0AAW2J250_9LAMI
MISRTHSAIAVDHQNLGSLSHYSALQIIHNFRQQKRDLETKEHILSWNPLILTHLFSIAFEAVTPRPKVNPYYDFEDVIDSDEELDLVSMVPDSGVQLPTA